MNSYRLWFAFVALILGLRSWAGDPKPSPLDGLDRKKVPAKVRPSEGAPVEVLAELGLRDARWDVVAARADGKALAASGASIALGQDSPLIVWSLPDFKPLAKLTHREVVALAFSPDGKVLAAGDAKGNLRLWSFAGKTVTSRAQLAAIHQDGPLWSLAFAPDGKSLATAGADGLIKLWDLKPIKPALKATIKAHEKVVRQLAFAPDGERLASAGSSDRTAKLWDLTGDQPREKAVLKCGGPVASLCFAPDGKSLATASFDGKVRIWDLDGDDPKAALTIEMGRKSVRLVQFAPGGKALAALLLDKDEDHIDIRDPEGTKLHDLDFKHHIQGMAFIDAHHLATANEDSVYILRIAKE